ncbi:hypothetical protein M9Y10_039365 [Tritrichomonas musculus]|uniref:ubiquitinyl hydrolase 1 n=1 Tax=Tritrichomonas musculus TaxID=1915356 RepID=A0ABR2KAZ9_9EUKA
MSDYTLHKVWETPPITKTKNTIQSSYYSAGKYNYCLLVVPPTNPKDYYRLYVCLADAPSTSHECHIYVKLCGRKIKEFNQTFFFSSGNSQCMIDNLISNSELKNYSRKDKLTIDFTITHSSKRTIPDFRTTTGYVGLINKSATCYMNSVLQLLFHIPAFRRLIYSIPYAADIKIPHALQRLFCLLQLSPASVSTQELIESFGWTQRESFVEHDIQEFIRVLLSNLEEKLKNTDLDGKVAEIFRGTMTHYIKCLNVDYQSNNQEDFYDVSVTVRGFKTLQDSLLSSVADERLDGDNQYNTEEFGKQDAVMGYKISKLPPVLHFHLTRFEYSPTSITGLAKVKDSFEFPPQLDMAPYVSETCEGDTKYELYSVLVHLGDSNGGHYISYCRPTTEQRWFRFNDEYIEEVDSTAAINNNFGGNDQMNHAYYLSYIKSSEVKWIMQKVTENDIPQQLLEYFESIKNSLDPRMTTITVVNMDKMKIRVPKDSSLRDVIKEIRKTNPNVKDLWSTNRQNLPVELLEAKDTIGNVDRVFAADFQAVKPYPVAFKVLFFFGKNNDSNDPLQDLGFMSFSAQSNIEKAMNEVKKAAGFPISPTKLICYGKNRDESLNQLSPETKLYDIPGVLIFELAPESTDAKTTFKFPEREVGLLKVRDLIPEIKLDDLEHYMNYSRQCIKVKIVNCEDSQNSMTIEISSSMHLRILIKCIRKAIELPETDSILLYLPVNDEDETKSQKTIINSYSTTDLKQIFDLRGNVKEIKVFFKKIANIAQADADQYAHFTIPLYNQETDLITVVELDMPSENTVSYLFDELKKRDDVPNDSKLRMVLLNRSIIEKTIDEQDKLALYVGKEVRVEMIPQDQLDIQNGEGFLIRCAFSHNAQYPPNGTILTPFYFQVSKDETFDLTKCRITSLIENDFGDLNFVLYTGKASTTRFIQCTDETNLFEVGDQPDAMLYIIISLQAILQMYKKLSNQGLKIYN